MRYDLGWTHSGDADAAISSWMGSYAEGTNLHSVLALATYNARRGGYLVHLRDQVINDDDPDSPSRVVVDPEHLWKSMPSARAAVRRALKTALKKASDPAPGL